MLVVFVAYPCPFKSISKFQRKLGKVLSHLKDFEVVFENDPNGFIERFCSDQEHLITCRRLPVDMILKTITHAIIFNDDDALIALINDIKAMNLPLREIQIPITKVVNKDKYEPYDVYIGRGSDWGNPYAVGFGRSPDEEPDDRDEAIRKFKYDFDRDYLKGGKKLKEKILMLRGKRLGCHCKPLACHGDVLAEYLNSYDDGK